MIILITIVICLSVGVYAEYQLSATEVTYTKSDGTGTAYYNMQPVKNLTTVNGATITLYAQWTPITYKVRFNGNGNWNTSEGSYTQQFTYDVSKPLISTLARFSIEYKS